MYRPVRNIYTIRTCPYNDNEKLENLLNDMSSEGWEIYSLQELENDNGVLYNCIFIKEIENDEISSNEDAGLFNFQSKIERIISTEIEPYDMCLDIQKKIKDTRMKISQVKSLIDETSEDSRTVLNDEISKYMKELDGLKKQLAKVINPDVMEQKLGEKKITLSLSEELTEIFDNDIEDNILSQIVLIRQNLTESAGYIIPKIKIETDDSLDENEFAIKIRGIPVLTSYAYPGFTMFYEKELNIGKLTYETYKDKECITNEDVIWINDEQAKDFWIKGYETTDYIAKVIEYSVIKFIDEIFDYSDINRYIEIVGNQNLYLVENIIPDYMSISELKYILASLIKERVSVKDIVYIFEKINDFADETDKEELLARLRVSLSRQISNSLAGGKNKCIEAYELSDSTVKLLLENQDNDEIIRIDTGRIKNIANIIKEKTKGNKEIILIAPMKSRHLIFLILSQMIFNIRVIAREELLFDYPLQIIGTI